MVTFALFNRAAKACASGCQNASITNVRTKIQLRIFLRFAVRAAVTNLLVAVCGAVSMATHMRSAILKKALRSGAVRSGKRGSRRAPVQIQECKLKPVRPIKLMLPAGVLMSDKESSSELSFKLCNTPSILPFSWSHGSGKGFPK